MVKVVIVTEDDVKKVQIFKSQSPDCGRTDESIFCLVRVLGFQATMTQGHRRSALWPRTIFRRSSLDRRHLETRHCEILHDFRLATINDYCKFKSVLTSFIDITTLFTRTKMGLKEIVRYRKWIYKYTLVGCKGVLSPSVENI